MSQPDASIYYIPHKSRWPFVAVLGMFLFMVGAANWLNGHEPSGQIILTLGALTIIGMMFGLAACSASPSADPSTGRPTRRSASA